MNQQANFDVPLLGSFREVCGRDENIAGIDNNCLGMKGSPFVGFERQRARIEENLR